MSLHLRPTHSINSILLDFLQEALLDLGAEEDVQNAMEYARVERLFDMMKLLQPYAEEEVADEELHGEL